MLFRAKKIRGAKAHPDAIVETGSLGSVEPPDPTYEHHIQVRVTATYHASAVTVSASCIGLQLTGYLCIFWSDDLII